MNKKQLSAIGWFFLIMQFFLIWFQATYLAPTTFIFVDELTPPVYYQLTKSAIVSSMIILCLPLFILFQVLAFLSSESNLLKKFSKKISNSKLKR